MNSELVTRLASFFIFFEFIVLFGKFRGTAVLSLITRCSIVNDEYYVSTYAFVVNVHIALPRRMKCALSAHADFFSINYSIIIAKIAKWYKTFLFCAMNLYDLMGGGDPRYHK